MMPLPCPTCIRYQCAGWERSRSRKPNYAHFSVEAAILGVIDLLRHQPVELGAYWMQGLTKIDLKRVLRLHLLCRRAG